MVVVTVEMVVGVIMVVVVVVITVEMVVGMMTVVVMGVVVMEMETVTVVPLTVRW